MARVNAESIRRMAIAAGKKVDAFLKASEEEFGFEVTSMTYRTEMCDDDLSDEDEFLGVTVGFTWVDEVVYGRNPLTHEANGYLFLSPKEFVSVDFVAGLLLAAIYEIEGVFSAEGA